MKLSYKQRLFLYVTFIFSLFTLGIIIFVQAREQKLKTESLEVRLEAYAEIIKNTRLLHPKENIPNVTDSLLTLLPHNIRLSLIDEDGKMLFDTNIEQLSGLDNHAQRPEIEQARKETKGTDIRLSTTTGHPYLYYASKAGDIYIRLALPYDIQIQRLMQPDSGFMYFIVGFFIVMLLLIREFTGRFGKSIRRLRDFALTSDPEEMSLYTFPHDELGEIGLKISDNYRQLQEAKKEAEMQREKLLQHVHGSEEGICFFSMDKQVEFYNGLFIQYLNTLADEAPGEPLVIFTDSTFSEIANIIEKYSNNYFETQIRKQGKVFSLRMNRFEDKSFEIILNDITTLEKTQLIKQEMTGNIAHELRTPVTSIRGYLETVLEQPLEQNQQRHFIGQAFRQTIVLSDLIQDISLITKMEEAPQNFKSEEVNIHQLLEELKHDLAGNLNEKQIDMQWSLPDKLSIKGNRSLLYAIFRNLTDNSIRYAGEGIRIHISRYNEDKEYHYFSFYDTGVGIVNEQHLPRLFERFYRVNEGRTRDSGGSGLGLSIVKHAVTLHKGSITAKNRKEGGLEFLFRLRKQ